MATNNLVDLIAAKFTRKYIESAVGHYQMSVADFQRSKWEDSSAKGGKFVEAVLKALWSYVGEPVPAGKAFKADSIINGLAGKPATFHDTVRLTIPRACRLVYDIASNRGGRHDPDEISPNQMDATVVVATCSWILAETLRFSQKGAMDFQKVADLVANLTQRRYAFSEDVDGRIYFSFKGLSARDVVLLALWKVHPRRMSRKELIATATRHGNSKANAEVGVSRLSKVADDDGDGNFRLLQRGIEEAEALIAEKAARDPNESC